MLIWHLWRLRERLILLKLLLPNCRSGPNRVIDGGLPAGLGVLQQRDSLGLHMLNTRQRLGQRGIPLLQLGLHALPIKLEALLLVLRVFLRFGLLHLEFCGGKLRVCLRLLRLQLDLLLLHLRHLLLHLRRSRVWSTLLRLHLLLNDLRSLLCEFLDQTVKLPPNAVRRESKLE
ncbi:hypothetical protein [Acetobacter cerevisiae]|uniref:hypothetical protein n=1 Tax=Acetobacter cerevisiae TaxID=178900 RepID=UPI001E287FCD|nr:hypothetical protein [Acetobacter cerevisiae]